MVWITERRGAKSRYRLRWRCLRRLWRQDFRFDYRAVPIARKRLTRKDGLVSRRSTMTTWSNHALQHAVKVGNNVTAVLKQLALAGALVAVGACHYDPYTFSYATSEPNLNEVVGHWVATDETLQGFAGGPYRGARPTIEVSRDGTIRMSAIPDTWRAAFGDGAGTLETFVGTWRLRKHQDSWWGLELQQGDWGCGGCLMVLGEKPPRKLVLRFGDPDAGLGYEFRRG